MIYKLQISDHRVILVSFDAGDDVVPFKFGEKSSKALTSSGFQDVTFKAYKGYVDSDPSHQAPSYLILKYTRATFLVFCSKYSGLVTTQFLRRWMRSVHG